MILEDNVLGKGAATSGKYMVYGKGDLKEKFLNDGITFDPETFFMHANHTDFQQEIIKPREKRKEQGRTYNNEQKRNGNTRHDKKRQGKKRKRADNTSE